MREESRFWMAVNAYHEAKGESYEGKVAVCHVVMNRMAKRKKTAKEVILQSKQFSWHNGNKFPAIRDYDAFLSCLEAVDTCLLERRLRKTLDGADHYFNPNLVRPSWAKNMKLIARIGDHDFYKS